MFSSTPTPPFGYTLPTRCCCGGYNHRYVGKAPEHVDLTVEPSTVEYTEQNWCFLTSTTTTTSHATRTLQQEIPDPAATMQSSFPYRLSSSSSTRKGKSSPVAATKHTTPSILPPIRLLFSQELPQPLYSRSDLLHDCRETWSNQLPPLYTDTIPAPTPLPATTSAPVDRKAPRPERNPPASLEPRTRRVGPGRKKISKVRATASQAAILEKVFKTEPIPCHDTRERLATQLGFTERKVQVWFQNKRAKLRRLAKEGAQD